MPRAPRMLLPLRLSRLPHPHLGRQGRRPLQPTRNGVLGESEPPPSDPRPHQPPRGKGKAIQRFLIRRRRRRHTDAWYGGLGEAEGGGESDASTRGRPWSAGEWCDGASASVCDVETLMNGMGSRAAAGGTAGAGAGAGRGGGRRRKAWVGRLGGEGSSKTAHSLRAWRRTMSRDAEVRRMPSLVPALKRRDALPSAKQAASPEHYGMGWFSGTQVRVQRGVIRRPPEAEDELRKCPSSPSDHTRRTPSLFVFVAAIILVLWVLEMGPSAARKASFQLGDGGGGWGRTRDRTAHYYPENSESSAPLFPRIIPTSSPFALHTILNPAPIILPPHWQQPTSSSLTLPLPIPHAEAYALAKNAVPPPRRAPTRPPSLKVRIEARAMKWQKVFFTVTKVPQLIITHDTLLRSTGELRGRWTILGKLCSTEKYALVRIREEYNHTATILAIPRAYIDLPDPSDQAERFYLHFTKPAFALSPMELVKLNDKMAWSHGEVESPPVCTVTPDEQIAVPKPQPIFATIVRPPKDIMWVAPRSPAFYAYK
ncbi:hypothetical protein DFH06DRAFT_1145601 [Mycena polygramma]|nr:hypothetical protein DFH06DRAFT_1145601 [Mycena polygramma]